MDLQNISGIILKIQSHLGQKVNFKVNYDFSTTKAVNKRNTIFV